MSIRIVNILEIKITNLALSLGHWADKSMININITGELTNNVAPEIPQLQISLKSSKKVSIKVI